MRSNQRILAISFAVCAVTAASARATIITVPTGLSPGDKYYLAFLTAGTISGTSPDVAVYNAFAQSQADAAGLGTIAGEPVTWKALVSTPTISASTNLGIGNFPIFRLDDVQIATGSSDLWDNSIAVPLNVTQTGATISTGGASAWTGSQSNGLAYPSYQLGSSLPIIGAVSSTTSTWLVVNAVNPANTLYVYAFSEELVVAVPEPASISIAACGVALGGLAVARRRRAARSA